MAAIFLILLADFGSARVATLVFLTLPFALVGAIVAAFLTGGVLSLGSLVGLVTVIGISARNGIMLISHYRHLELQEGMAFGRDLILRGSEERLAPILMTALATGLALVPIVLGGTRAGYEIEHPLAVVILGGLVTSTLAQPLHRAGALSEVRTFGTHDSGRKHLSAGPSRTNLRPMCV